MAVAASLGVVTVITFWLYLKSATQDPGYIHSMMFNKAYLQNQETEVSQYNQETVTPQQVEQLRQILAQTRKDQLGTQDVATLL